MKPQKTPILKEAVTLAQVEDKLMTIHGQRVLLDSDVAALYAVETREINQAVKNNPDKFPEGYVVQLSKDEWQILRSQIVILKENELIKNFDQFRRKHSASPPKAFTEKGLYMLATILKGAKATGTSLAIVETFAKTRELSRTVAELAKVPDEPRQKNLMQKSGEIMADLISSDLSASGTETTFELNFAVMKFKHVIKRKST